MAQKAQVVKVRSITELVSTKTDENTIVVFTPRDFLFAPLKPRLINGRYGLRMQIAQFKGGAWSQISISPDNFDVLAKSIEALTNMLESLEHLGHIDVPIETLQASASALESAVNTLRRIVESKSNKSKSNSK